MNAPDIPAGETARLRVRELRERLISLVNPANHASIRVVARIGERLDGRIDHMGGQRLPYGLDRATYFRQIEPEAAMARRAG
jgi:RimJ/RimL family protein N-acetyltransferase